MSQRRLDIETDMHRERHTQTHTHVFNSLGHPRGGKDQKRSSNTASVLQYF